MGNQFYFHVNSDYAFRVLVRIKRTMLIRKSFYVPIVIFILIYQTVETLVCEDVVVDCQTLRWGQFKCPDPNLNYDYIDKETQQPKGCTKDNKAKGTFLLRVM